LKDKTKTIIWGTQELEYGVDYASADSRTVAVLGGHLHTLFPQCKECGSTIKYTFVHDSMELIPCELCEESKIKMKGICEE
jgi:hypothetical protein